MKTPALSFVLAALGALSAGAAGSVACTRQVAMEDHPCPCSAGWTCCASANVCVAEGASCPKGSGADDKTIELATAQSVRCMATDRDHVFWQNAEGLVVGNAKTGGQLTVSKYSTPGATNPLCGLAVEGDTIFATSYAEGDIAKLAVYSSNGGFGIGGDGTRYGPLTTPSSLAVEPDAIYVTEYEAGRVTKQPRSREPGVPIATGLVKPHGIAVDAQFVYVVEQGDERTLGAVKRIRKSDGQIEVLARDQHLAVGLTMRDGRLYWIADNFVRSVSTQGGGVTVLSSRAIANNVAPVVDVGYVYFPDTLLIMRVPIGGGPESVVMGGAVGVFTIDETRLFWTTSSEVFSRLR